MAAMVINDHRKRPQPSTNFLFNRSAAIPTGSTVTAYVAAKVNPINSATCESVMLKVFLDRPN